MSSSKSENVSFLRPNSRSFAEECEAHTALLSTAASLLRKGQKLTICGNTVSCAREISGIMRELLISIATEKNVKTSTTENLQVTLQISEKT